MNRYKSVSKRSAVWLMVVVSLWFSLMGGAAKVQALRTECTEAWLRDIGATTVTCNDVLQCGTDGSAPIAPLVGNADVFVIGDSLTYGMVKLGGLLDKMSTAGFKVNTAYETPDSKTVTGPSVEAVGGYAIQQMQRNIEKHSQDFVRANAVMIALGTNHDGNFAYESRALI